MENLIELRDIHFAYPQREEAVFSGLDFVWPSSTHLGGNLAITGHNGCGKSTLLKIIMGLLTPQTGQVKVFARLCAAEADFYEVRRSIGFVFQDAEDQLFCPTVEEDIAFGPLNLGLSPKEAKARAGEVLEQIGLPGYGERVTYALSGGEKKLVALGTALAMRPKMLLLDEPTAGLDTDAKARVLSLLRALNLPCLLVSHDHDFLSQLNPALLNLEDCKGK